MKKGKGKLPLCRGNGEQVNTIYGHHLTVRARFAFNCYRYWAQLLLYQPGDAPVIILIPKGVNQGDPLLVIPYGINLVPLMEELRDADPTLLYPFLCQ